MKLLSFYIINEDGRCIYDFNFVPDPPPSQLITGLLTAMQNFVQEMTGGYVNHFSAGGYTFVIQPTGPLMVVVALGDEFSIGENIPLTEIGIMFLKQFGERIEKWKGDMDEFAEFETTLRSMLRMEEVTHKIEPTNPLNAMTLIQLPEELQRYAKVILEKRNLSVEEMKREIENFDPAKAEELVQKGHIGKLIKDHHIVYFI